VFESFDGAYEKHISRVPVVVRNSRGPPKPPSSFNPTKDDPDFYSSTSTSE
jgi:hypothetical protein